MVRGDIGRRRKITVITEVADLDARMVDGIGKIDGIDDFGAIGQPNRMDGILVKKGHVQDLFA